jgi:NAD(P)-dependent dehydrogenase (short-subunit alcohol dehydrogenase family)
VSRCPPSPERCPRSACPLSAESATPADLGKAAVFLASSESEYIHGVELEVDGGVAQI